MFPHASLQCSPLDRPNPAQEIITAAAVIVQYNVNDNGKLEFIPSFYNNVEFFLINILVQGIAWVHWIVFAVMMM